MATTAHALLTDKPPAPKLDASKMPIVAAGTKRARALSPASASRLNQAATIVSVDVVQGKENVNPSSVAAGALGVTSVRAASTFTGAAAGEAAQLPLCNVGCETASGEVPRCALQSAADSAAASPAKPSIYDRLKGKVIEVEGNIGSGKSTLTRNLSELAVKDTEDSEYSVVHGEKVNSGFLKAFYENTKQYAFAFQMYMLTTRIYQMDESYRQADKEGKLVFLDRGAVGDVLFALQNYKIGNMNDLDMQVYKSVCTERLPSSLAERVDAVLYLDVSPKMCWYRMTTVRQREAEEGVPLAYLEGIDSVYFHLLVDWLGARKGGFYDMNIGTAPKVMIVRWDDFGCTRDVISELADLVEGARASPTVAFTLADTPESAMGEEEGAAERKYDAVYRDSASLEAAYAQLQAKGAAGLPELRSIAIDWALPHDEAFRRVAMYVLSETGHVTFFGPATAQETPKFNCPPKA